MPSKKLFLLNSSVSAPLATTILFGIKVFSGRKFVPGYLHLLGESSYQLLRKQVLVFILSGQ